ncbi:hypothetical protein [Aeromonas phage 51]|uniref:Uncharacterized protein n=3 Tax=Popoffvirus pv56 TaxID=2560283 RepID=A0A219YB93_9CAUD|nr:Rz-like spanin [Aeromonas phage vB_AsaM-56]AFC22598.1 hypothetical protein AsaM-56_0002 [Aeromonas phage vB_AsaM-56]APU01225.1 hypothetical protein [Aeromonas phage 51]APU01309.1 hypothetical protein [Aeromonas phage 56]
MTIPAWVKLSAVLALLAAYGAWCYHSGAASARADAAEQAVEAWGEMAALAGRLSASDQRLATAQALIMQGVAVEVTKREVIYRERIKDPAVHRCVADSGLLELIDAANGFDSAKR